MGRLINSSRIYGRILLSALFYWLLIFRASGTGTPFFSTLSMRDGLPSNIIAAIAQDKHDFLWIGTGSGLARYDGYGFDIFKRNETIHSLPSNELSALLADDEYIWVGTWSGLCKIHIETFRITRIDLGRSVAIRTLHKGKNNVLWIGTSEGLFRYTMDTGVYELYSNASSGLSHNTVRAIFEDMDGNLWVGTYNQLNKLTAGENRFLPIDLKGDYRPSLKNHLILDIKPDHSAPGEAIWVGTETGLYHLNTRTGEKHHYGDHNVSLSNEVIKCIYSDETHKLWLGTDFGLNVFNVSQKSKAVHFHNPQLPYSIANNVIWQIFKDRSGVIWIVTSNGLSRVNNDGNFYEYQAITHRVSNQPIGNQVKSILISSNRIYWLGTQHGVIRLDPKTGDKQLFDTSSPPSRRILLNNVFALEEDRYGRIWIGTAGGINVWDEGTKTMHAITANGINGLTSNYIAKFTRTSDSSFWISAWEGGLYKLKDLHQSPERFAFELVAGPESGSEKTVAGNQALWVVAYDELYRLDPSTFSRTPVRSFSRASKKQMIYCVYFSRDGHLWAGTLNGLVQYLPKENKSVFHPVTTGNDVIISSIIEDGEGNIWSTSNASLQKLYPGDRKMEIYPLDKDLPLKSFFYGCAATAPTGEIIFGGDNGYITFLPEKAKPNLFNPKVFITELEINNKPIVTGEPVSGNVLLKSDVAFEKELILEYEQRSVTFEFSALHFWQPSMNVYAYRLDGLEGEWKYVSGTKNFAVYSNLPSGEYTFMVRGTNNYGVQGDQLATLALTIKPPILLSKGFLALYVIVLAGLIYYGLSFYTARVHLKNEIRIITLEKEHAEELEHTKEQFFTNISHELRTPISLILPPIHEIQKKGVLDEQSSQLIWFAEKNAVRLLRLVNQILDFNKLENETLQIKVSEVDLVVFCHDVFSLFSDQAKRHEIQFTFLTTHPSSKVWVDVEKIETVLFNLLSNAFKFTPNGGQIILSIQLLQQTAEFKDGAFEIEVRDTGIGMSEPDKTRIFERFYQTEAGKKLDASSGIGLTLAAEYVELHHGSIRVDSTPGMGTSFRVILPLGKSHFPIDSVTAREVSLLATRSAYPPQQGTKTYQLELESDKPMVLIIDDNNDMTDFIRTSLGYKYNFIVAENGEEGLRKAGNFLPEVIISDIMMPVMDGLELCKQIKENPKTCHITIILLTARSLESQRLEGIRQGADVYITKPFEISLLEAHVDNLIHRKAEMTRYFRSVLINQQHTPAEKDNVDNKFLKKVMDVIEANITDPEFGVEMISREIGMSATHLYRRLKALTDRSPQDIIKKYRVKKASLLLQNNEGNVSETMYRVGFSSLSYFSKCFKAEFGMTPKEYQQSMDKKQNVSSESQVKSGA